MKYVTRIWVKLGIVVVTSVDVDTRDLNAKLCELRVQYPGHSFRTSQLDPLGV